MSINTRTGRDTTHLRAGIAERLTVIQTHVVRAREGNPQAWHLVTRRDAPQLTSALDETLAYLDKCEDIGITPTACDLRSLIAAALEVTT